MRRRSAPHARWLATIIVLAVGGVSAAAYVLRSERFPDPTRDTYPVEVVLSAADGVAGGLGQPVQVAGVQVGAISGVRVSGGHALVTLSLDRGELPQIYRDATVALRPITPLKDMRVDLNPGHPRAGRLPSGSRLPMAQTSTPVDLADVLSVLDTDTRTFLSSLIASVGDGTSDRGLDLRRALLALGPTAAQARAISVALDSRRMDIQRLVHNLAIVTRASADDGQLATVVDAGNTTLQAIATQDRPLRRSIAELSPTLQVTTSALGHATAVADELRPTLTALEPSVQRLPATLRDLRPFAGRTTRVLREQIRPLARVAAPVVGDLGAAVGDTRALTPHLQSAFMVLEYLANELAYNPPGSDEGMLFWAAWAAHNLNSLTSFQDANGSWGRAVVFANCRETTQNSGPLGFVLQGLLGLRC
jgi:phospholipid/cholesterol/gamma-HCH transport system substrate-binding protein